MPVYHNMQNQTNLMNQTQENGRKPQIWANLGPFFFKTRLRHFLKLITGYYDAKNLRNPMIGFREKPRTDTRTDGQTAAVKG